MKGGESTPLPPTGLIGENGSSRCISGVKDPPDEIKRVFNFKLNCINFQGKKHC